MYTYLVKCKDRHISQLSASYKSVRTRFNRMENEDISKEFLSVLNLSSKTVCLQRRRYVESKMLINMLETKMHRLYTSVMQSTETKFNDIIALGISYCNMDIIDKNQDDNTSTERLLIREKNLNKCLEILKGKELDRRAILTVMRACIQMDDISCKLQQSEKSIPFLYKGFELYFKYTRDQPLEPLSVRQSVGLNVEGKQFPNSMLSLVKLYSKILDQINKLKIFDQWNRPDFVITIHNFLMTQLTTISAEPLETCAPWIYVMNRLALNFIDAHRMTEAQNCLIAAEYALDMYHKELSNMYGKVRELFAYKYRVLCANICLSWSVYGKTLLLISKYTLLYGQIPVQKQRDKFGSLFSTVSEESAKLFSFTSLKENLKYITVKIPDTPVSKFNDATLLSIRIMKYLKTARRAYEKAYDNINYYALIYNMGITQKLVMFFESDGIVDIHERKKVYKHILLLLLHIYKQLNKRRHPDVFWIHNISYGIVSITTVILNNIIDNREITGMPFKTVGSKMRSHIQRIVTFYDIYIETCNRILSLPRIL